ncbi:MAG: nuclear transport factor 2 family protein [Burkholderiales bacterium]
MGRSTIAFVVGLFLGASLMFEACASGQNAEAELADLEQAIMKSAVSGDRDTYSAILDPDWRTIDITGQVLTKAQVLERMFAVRPGPIAEGAIDDVHVRVFDDAAVVTGRTAATARTGVKVVLRFTDVFVRRNARWQVVASQGTRVAP